MLKSPQGPWNRCSSSRPGLGIKRLVWQGEPMREKAASTVFLDDIFGEISSSYAYHPPGGVGVAQPAPNPPIPDRRVEENAVRNGGMVGAAVLSPPSFPQVRDSSADIAYITKPACVGSANGPICIAPLLRLETRSIFCCHRTGSDRSQRQARVECGGGAAAMRPYWFGGTAAAASFEYTLSLPFASTAVAT